MPTTFRHAALPNGLNVIAEVVPDAATAAVGFFVKTGARDEELPVMGVSHFLEHMMFKGTARRSAHDVNREFDEIGANYNAFTSHEQTVYYAATLPEMLPRAVDLFSDMLRPALRDEDFDVEKKVILEEIGMYQDRPQWRLHDALLEAHFARHPLGYRVLGTTESITALPVGAMRDYFNARYSPDNITVAAAGRLDFDALVADVTQRCGQWSPTAATRNHGGVAPPAGQAITLSDAKLTRHYIGLMSQAPAAGDEQRFAARVLADALGDEEGSRLYWALIDPGLADEADFNFMPLDHAGAFYAFASCDPERAAQVEELLTTTIDSAAAGLTDDEIERVKNKLATGVTLQGERPAGRMHALGHLWTYLGEYQPLSEQLARIMAVTADDVRDLLRATPLTPRTVVRLGPIGKA